MPPPSSKPSPAASSSRRRHGHLLHKVDLDITKDYCGARTASTSLAKTRPDVVQKIHESFLEVGADAVGPTPRGARHVLADLTSRTSVRPQQVRAEVPAPPATSTQQGQPRFAAGSMGPGTKLITLNQIDWDKMSSPTASRPAAYRRGVDVPSSKPARTSSRPSAPSRRPCALDEKAKTTDDIPLMVSVTIETTGTHASRHRNRRRRHRPRRLSNSSLGLNCATGPPNMSEHIHYLGKHWASMVQTGWWHRRPACAGCFKHHPSPLHLLPPNAALPILHDGRTEYPLTPPLRRGHAQVHPNDGVESSGAAADHPEHIKQLAQAVEEVSRRSPRPPLSLSPKAGLK